MHLNKLKSRSGRQQKHKLKCHITSSVVFELFNLFLAFYSENILVAIFRNNLEIVSSVNKRTA